MNAASQGDKAIEASDWPAAIQHFTRALIELPRAAPYYIKRSTAYSRLKPANGGPDSQAALRDAEIALVLARERGKRELILSAQMRRGVALYQLERYGDASYVFGVVKDKIGGADAKKDRSDDVQAAMAAQQGGGGAAGRSKDRSYEQELPIWMMKVKGKLDQLPEGDEKAVVTVREYPENLKVPSEQELRKALDNAGAAAGDKEKEKASQDDKSKKDTAAPSPAPVADKTKEATLDAVGKDSSSAPFSAGPAAPAGRVRHEWYQSHDSVVITLYVKGVPKDKVDVDIKSDSLSLQFPTPSGSEFSFNLDPLFAPIDPSQSKCSVMSTKVEVVLRKQLPGQKWNTLESTTSTFTTEKLADRTAIPSTTTTAPAPAPAAAPSTTATTTDATATAPAYPTSSRRGVKDWDKLASDLTAKKAKSKAKGKAKEKSEEEGEESDAESIDSDYGTGDPVDAFFKKLYANADPDTRRAMVKSYYESQGTALSTNWAEVGKGKVEPRPPSD